MKAADVMTRRVVSLRASAQVSEAVHLMTSHRISGLPVVDDSGAPVGMVTEGDFLRRQELGTEKHRARWIDFLSGPNAMAARYVHTHSRKIADVMSSPAVTVTEDTPLDEVVRLMETKNIKRLPVTREGRVVGIVSRSNLLQALAALQPRDTHASDQEIRDAILKEVEGPLAVIGRCDVIVQDGVVNLWGTVFSNPDAIRVAAENAPGVKSVHCHLVWVDPFSGILIEDPDAASHEQATSAA